MKLLIASTVWVVIGSWVPPLAIFQPELFPRQEAATIQAQCPSNCQGDFPVSSNRKYAEAREAHRWS